MTDDIGNDSRWNRPFSLTGEQPGAAEFAFSFVVGVAALVGTGFLLEMVGYPQYGKTAAVIPALPILIGMNTLRARPETYSRNAFWLLRTIVYSLSIMAGTCTMIFVQDFLGNGYPQPWSAMLVFAPTTYVVGLPLMLTTERLNAARLRRFLLFVYPALVVILATVIWLFDLIFD